VSLRSPRWDYWRWNRPTTSYKENIRPYAGNALRHALSDLLVQQLFMSPSPEAYYRPFARELKRLEGEYVKVFYGPPAPFSGQSAARQPQ
jgi:hypothetical protein